MASFPPVTMTTEGLNMIAKASSGNSQDRLIITKVKLGDGVSEGNIRDYTDVISSKKEVTLAEWEDRGDGRFRYTFIYNNEGVKTGFYHREIGLFAKNGDSGTEKLIAYSNAGSYPSYIDDETKEIPYQRLMINIGVGDTDNVTGNVDVSNVVTIEKLNEHNEDVEAHSNLLKRLLVTDAKLALNTDDWNNLIESRTYKIVGATFVADKHQPVGAAGTGELIVQRNGDDTIAQVYYANSTEFDKAGAYHRINIGGVWSDWIYNITNKGGTIDKITATDIKILNNLYIGDSVLTEDALKKIQDQIISPSQSIYVNSVSGNDNNDGSSSSKAVKTLSKAYSLIKKEVPIINIILNNSVEDMVYEAEPLDLLNGSYSTEKITFKAEINQSSGIIHPTIKLKYGKVIYKSGYHNGKWQSQYMIGNILFNGNAELNIQYIDFVVDTIKPINVDYRNFLCRTPNFNAQNCNFTLPKYTLMACSGNNCTFNLYYCNLNNNTDYFIRYVEDIPVQWENEIDYTTQVKTSAESAFAFALINGTTIPDSVKSLQGSGIATSIGVIRKNW